MLDVTIEALCRLPDSLATLGRDVVVWLAAPLGSERRRRLERWLRGRQQVLKLRRADAVVVSCGKSGRTWLRVMLSGFYQHVYGLPSRTLLGFDNLHRSDRRIPRIFFTHDSDIADYTGHRDSKADFYPKKVILLARSPQDTVVSQYFQWKHRMGAHKKWLTGQPDDEGEVSIFDFAMRPGAGIAKIITFLNLWAEEAPHMSAFLFVRYEDLRRDPIGELRRIVEFLGAPVDGGAIRSAVDFASVENMRSMEARKAFRFSGKRMSPSDRSNPDSYKVRRAKVGGYRDYFDDDEIARIDGLVEARLSPFFGYGRGALAGKSSRRHASSSE